MAHYARSGVAASGHGTPGWSEARIREWSARWPTRNTVPELWGNAATTQLQLCTRPAGFSAAVLRLRRPDPGPVAKTALGHSPVVDPVNVVLMLTAVGDIATLSAHRLSHGNFVILSLTPEYFPSQFTEKEPQQPGFPVSRSQTSNARASTPPTTKPAPSASPASIRAR